MAIGFFRGYLNFLHFSILTLPSSFFFDGTTFMDNYWTERYNENNTPWDMGSASPPLTAYLQGLVHKNQKILIPGAGNAYEVEWLHRNGFSNIYVMDISRVPLENLKKRVPDFPESHVIFGDFFELKQKFELIIEQTFFCALPPSMRQQYAEKMADVLVPGGKLTGVLFNFPLTEQGPPFGGNQDEYESLFDKHFTIAKMEHCYNSIPPRSGNELFFELIKP